MKKTNKINLNQLAKKAVDMKKNEMKIVRGGRQVAACCCICVNPGAPEADHALADKPNTAV